MAKFMLKASYSQSGLKGVISEGGSSRAQAVGDMISGLGGSMEAFYFAFGDTDVYVVAELPDNAAAAAIAATIGASGALSSFQTVVLLAPEEIDGATKQAVSYRPPGA